MAEEPDHTILRAVAHGRVAQVPAVRRVNAHVHHGGVDGEEGGVPTGGDELGMIPVPERVKCW